MQKKTEMAETEIGPSAHLYAYNKFVAIAQCI